MQLLQLTRSHLRFVRHGRYVAARLDRSQRTTLAQSARDATEAVLASGRAREDVGFGLQDQLALRDSADDALDSAAQDVRRILAASSADATETAPYKEIFPQGIGYYTAATLGTQVQRYTELIQRLENYLPEDDPVRVDITPILRGGLEDFEIGAKAVKDHRIKIAISNTELLTAKEDYNRVMERIYGLLLADGIGRANAERFFPRLRASSSSSDDVDLDDLNDDVTEDDDTEA